MGNGAPIHNFIFRTAPWIDTQYLHMLPFLPLKTNENRPWKPKPIDELPISNKFIDLQIVSKINSVKVKTEKLSLKILLMHVVQRCETTLNYLEIREDTKNTTFFLTTCLVSMHFCKLIVVFSQMHFCVKPINKESLLKPRIRWGLKRWFSNICIHKKVK